jgi:hypothetical protein
MFTLWAPQRKKRSLYQGNSNFTSKIRQQLPVVTLANIGMSSKAPCSGSHIGGNWAGAASCLCTVACAVDVVDPRRARTLPIGLKGDQSAPIVTTCEIASYPFPKLWPQNEPRLIRRIWTNVHWIFAKIDAAIWGASLFCIIWTRPPRNLEITDDNIPLRPWLHQLRES